MNSVTDTAQAFGSIINGVNALSGMNIGQILMLLAGLVVGFIAISGGVQHVLELVYSWFPNLPFWVKPFLPKVISSALGYLMTYSHMDSATCTAIAGTLMLTIEGVNKSPLALDLEAKVAAAKADVTKLAVPKPTGGAPRSVFGFLLVAFLGLGAGLHSGVMELNVPLSPTAGASYIENTWVTMPTMFDLNHGDFTLSPTFYVGWQTTWQWGPTYGLGLTLGGNVNEGTPTAPTQGHLCAGVVANFESLELGLLGDDKGGHIGLAKAW